MAPCVLVTVIFVITPLAAQMIELEITRFYWSIKLKKRCWEGENKPYTGVAIHTQPGQAGLDINTKAGFFL